MNVYIYIYKKIHPTIFASTLFTIAKDFKIVDESINRTTHSRFTPQQ